MERGDENRVECIAKTASSMQSAAGMQRSPKLREWRFYVALPESCLALYTDAPTTTILLYASITDLMARIKHIPRPKPAKPTQSSARKLPTAQKPSSARSLSSAQNPPTTQNASPAPGHSSEQRATPTTTTWAAVIELGASNGQAMVKKPGGQWELVRWAQGVGASSVGGAEAIPAMSAVKREGRSAEMRHGHAAVRARKKNPSDWEMFSHPKLIFMGDEGIPVDIQRTLQLQDKKARDLKTTPKDVAIGFFQHMIQEAIGARAKDFKIYLNVSDCWRNSKVQELMLSFQSLWADVQFEAVDECLCSLVGRISSDPGKITAEGLCVVVDCGHSTLNVGLAEIASGPTYKVHQYETEDAGAGAINLAVEDVVRRINETNGAISGDANVWEVSEFIDDYFKPEPETDSAPRFGFSPQEWDRIMDRAKTANAKLDSDRVEIVQQKLTDAAVKLTSAALTDAPDTDEAELRILLTGRGARSPTFQAALKNMVSQGFPSVSIHEDRDTHSTAVLAGLVRIADNPDIMSVTEAPVSLWMRSDPDDVEGEERSTTVVRICTRGSDLDGGKVRDRLSSSHPVHIELVPSNGDPVSLDLSIFGTPEGVSDDEIVVGWNADQFAYTSTERVTEFGRYQRQLSSSFASDGESVFHVYIYTELFKLSVQLYAVFAGDGHEITALSRMPIEEAIQGGRISEKWRRHKRVDLDVVRLRQVARPEALSTKPRHSSSPSNQLRATPRPSALLAGKNQLQRDRSSAAVKITGKRTLPKKSHLQQAELTYAKRRRLSNRLASDVHGIWDVDTESDPVS